MSETIAETPTPGASASDSNEYSQVTAAHVAALAEQQGVRTEELPSEAAARERGLLAPADDAKPEVPPGFWEEVERQTQARAEALIEQQLAPLAAEYGVEAWQLRLLMEASDDPEEFRAKYEPELARDAARVELEQRAEAAKQVEAGDALARDLVVEFEGELGELGSHDDVLERAGQLFPSMMEHAAELRRLYPDNPVFADEQMVAAACVRMAAEATATEREGTQRIDAELDHLEQLFGRKLNSRDRVTVATLAEVALPKFGDDYAAVRQALHAVVRDELGEPKVRSMTEGMRHLTAQRAREMRLERETSTYVRDDRPVPASMGAAMRPFHEARKAGTR